MKYDLTTARRYINENGEPDYEGTVGFEIHPKSIYSIRKAMDLLGIEIWKIEKDRREVWKSPLWIQIEDRRIPQDRSKE